MLQNLTSKSENSLKLHAMSVTSMISKVETVLSIQNNPQEFKKQSIKNSRKLDLRLKGQLSGRNHQQTYSLHGQCDEGGKRQIDTRTSSLSSEESCYNSTDSGHCTDSGYKDDTGREGLTWKVVEPSSKVNMLGNRRSQTNQSNEFIRRPWHHKRQESKVIIKVKSEETSETIPPRHDYSKASSLIQPMHKRRIFTDSRGTACAGAICSFQKH